MINNPPLRRFELIRKEDVSGVSGTGIVAEGVSFDDGKTVLRWRVKQNGDGIILGAISIWDTLEDMLAVHGHEGRTSIIWID